VVRRRDGVVLGLGGSVTNAAGASIIGLTGGVYIKYRAAGTVTNSGIINAASATGTGVDLGGGGTVTNNSGVSISGGGFGSISGSHGVGMIAGGSVTNEAAASISGQVAGVISQGAAVTLINAGNISATGAEIRRSDGHNRSAWRLDADWSGDHRERIRGCIQDSWH
jgi:hypothetical protein